MRRKGDENEKITVSILLLVAVFFSFIPVIIGNIKRT